MHDMTKLPFIHKNKKVNFEEWLYILVILFVLLVLFLYLIKILEFPDTNTSSLVWSILFSFPFVVVMTFINYYSVRTLNRIKFLRERMIVRLIVEYLYAIIIATIFVLIGNLPFKDSQDSLWDFLSSGIIEASFITAILINIVSVTLLEFIYQSKENRIKEVEYEKLQKQSIAFQYEVLREQINPHFLFNCFSILSSLINKDVRRANEFLYNLSDTYRYVLSHNTNTLVEVREELGFLENYINILNVRFTEGLKIVVKIEENDMSKQIIPMTLQILLENAVKHNKISEEQPLVVEILSDNQSILVRNNINKKTTEKTTSIGLNNLKSKYQLLNSSLVEIESDSNLFSVKIPLV